jgi:hypothetical protein
MLTLVRLGAVAGVMCGAVIGLASSAQASSQFGPGDSRWDAYYANPTDTGTWGPYCQGAGGSFLATADGVPACGPTGGVTIDFPGGDSALGFQCTELAKRFLYVTHGWLGISATNGAQVVSHYGAAHNVAVINNSTAGRSPGAGTVVSFSTNSSFSDVGHVAVVTANNVSQAGRGSITVVSENYANTVSTDVLQVSGWTVLSKFKTAGGLALSHVEWLDLGNPPPPPPAPVAAPLGSLVRYYNPSTGQHWASTRGAPSGYQPEVMFGEVSLTPVDGGKPLYECVAAGTSDQFMSNGADCDGYTVQAQAGYLYSAPPAGIPTLPVYRCFVNGDHIISQSAACEGYQPSGLLGYTQAAAAPPPSTALSLGDVSRVEGNSGATPFMFTITRTGPTAGASSVVVNTASGTAVAPDDYDAVVNRTVSFGTGETSKTVTVNVVGDTSMESNETFTVNLSSPVGATIADGQGVGTIVNDDNASLPTVTISDVSKAEGNKSTTKFVFKVSLSAVSTSAVTVKFATANGTAVMTTDYKTKSG